MTVANTSRRCGSGGSVRLGAHAFVFTDHWTDASLGILDQARELGLDGVEIPVGDDVVFDVDAVRRRAEALGLSLVISPGAEWPLRYDLSSANEPDRRAGLDWHRAQLDLAAELGAQAYAGSLYGHPGVVRRERRGSEEWRWAADGLHQLACHGARRGVAVVIEPMSHFRTHVVNTADQAVRLLALADHPNLWVLLDTYHMVTEVTDFGGAIRAVGERLWGLHACENDRGCPGTGIVPWQEVFRALGDIAFDGWLTLEAYNSSIDDFAIRRGMFHNVCPDGAAFVRQGSAFLRAGMQSRPSIPST